MRLSELKVKQTAIITKVNRTVDGNADQQDLVASRLETLGFVPGEKVEVITKGVFGGDPILVQLALRCVKLKLKRLKLARTMEFQHE